MVDNLLYRCSDGCCQWGEASEMNIKEEFITAISSTQQPFVFRLILKLFWSFAKYYRRNVFVSMWIVCERMYGDDNIWGFDITDRCQKVLCLFFGESRWNTSYSVGCAARAC